MKKVLLASIISCILFSPLFAQTEGVVETTDESKTIKELHDSIKDLKIEKRDLGEKWKELSKENGKISDFIKQDITLEEQKAIEEIVGIYFSKKEVLEAQLKEAVANGTETESLKNDIIKIKLDLYKSLTSYVKVDKLKEYVGYIKGNLEIVKEERDIKDDIYKKEEILGRKVEAVKEKIQANNKLLDEKIRQLIREKMAEKIQKLLDNPVFVSLDKEKKKQVFEATLKKIEEKKEALNKIFDQTSLVEKKIEIYTIVEEKLKEQIAKYQ